MHSRTTVHEIPPLNSNAITLVDYAITVRSALKYSSYVTEIMTARITLMKACVAVRIVYNYNMYPKWPLREVLFSDEELCNRTMTCSHFCHNAPEGLVCYCPEGLYLQLDLTTCLDSHPCSSWGACSQRCIALKNRHKCVCEDDYQLQSDGFTCKSKSTFSRICRIGLYSFLIVLRFNFRSCCATGYILKSSRAESSRSPYIQSESLNFELKKYNSS